MTNEESIKQIRWYFEEDDGSGAEPITKKAISLAISALERDRWISVEERFPDISEKQSSGDWSQKVLFWCKPGFEAVGYYNVSKEYWLTADEVSEYDWGEVTHWRPLPEPPKELV